MPVANFTVAVNERYQKGDSWETRTNYVDCVLFGSRAEKLASALVKGTKVCVSGSLRYSAWEKDGQKRSKIELAVSELEIPYNASKRDSDEYIPFE